jgi:hypothetical protein
LVRRTVTITNTLLKELTKFFINVNAPRALLVVYLQNFGNMLTLLPIALEC